ncbi:MAG: hypothetical protein ACRDD2_03225 [Sarcina sp.]
MNRKQFRVTAILLSLMVVMVVGEKFFTGKIKDVALINNNIESMLTYRALDGEIIYDLPDNWAAKEVSYPGDYIIYNNDFYGEEMGINGSVQIIKSKSTVEEIVKSEVEILEQENAKEIKKLDDRVGEKSVKKVLYEEKSKDGKVYEGKIYYSKLPKDDLILKLSFISGKDKYKENYETIYRIILDSFKMKL